MVAVYLLLAATLLGMSAAAYFLFAEFPFALGGLNAFAPAFLIANLTFFLRPGCFHWESVLCKSRVGQQYAGARRRALALFGAAAGSGMLSLGRTASPSP